MSDLIDRQAAIDAIEITPFDDYGDYMRARELIEQLPSAQPQACDDAISREDAKWVVFCNRDHVEDQTNAIDSLPCVQSSAQPQPQWIPVTKRLPEEYKDVLCYYEYFRYGDYNCMFRTIDRGYYGNGRWGGEAGQGHKNKVLAWMPLPEPYKERRTDDKR